MKLERALIALVAGLLAQPLCALNFDAPSGLTIHAKEGGRFQLLWDPIYRDDLSGYSIWLRRPGEREFTRLSIPVRVGKELRKMPVTNEARLVLALGSAKRDVEVTVVAEYEDGVSERSRSVFSSRAALPPAAPVEEDGAPQAQSPTVQASTSPLERPKPSPEPTPDRGIPEDQPWQDALPQAERPLLTPFKGWRSELGIDFSVVRLSRQGQGSFSQTGLSVTAIPAGQQVQWKRGDERVVMAVPLTLRWGLVPGFEAWGQAAFDSEVARTTAFTVDGVDYKEHVVYQAPTGRTLTAGAPAGSGFGDAKLGLRVQPFSASPLVLGAEAAFPTGQSRFQSYLDWASGRDTAAGTGDGVMRMRFSADFGYRGQRRGLSFHGAYSPGVTERVKRAFMGVDMEHTFKRGDRIELGGAYSFPWSLGAREGALVLGAGMSSTEAARWTANGVELTQGGILSDVELARLSAAAWARFSRDDAMEISIQAFQDLPGGVRSGARLAYLSQLQGDTLLASAQFYY